MSDTPPLLPLDWQRVAGALRRHRPAYRLHFLPTTPSTNDVARDLAGQGAPDGSVVVADAQTAGRGRAGKSPWLTPARTSLAVSVLLRPPLAPAHLSRLGMAAGVAAVAAVGAVAGIAAGLKWPNDVVCDGRKVGGILVESALSGSDVSHAVVGVGLNVNVPAAALGAFADAALPPVSLIDLTGRPVSREALLLHLLRELGDLLDQLYAGRAETVLASFRQAQTLLGQPVRVTGAGAGEPIDGVAEGVTADGALILRLPDGRRAAFAYGEATLRPTSPAAPSAGPRP